MQKNVTKQFKLDNGLKIVVREDHRAPVVVSQVWYKVGAVDESRGTTGLSHALEHMMFLGTKSVPNGEFSKIIGDLGGYENAFTSEDQTVYYEEIANQHLETCLKLEADRMQNLAFNKDEVSRELEVIKEERRLRVEDNPQSLTWERFMATAYVAGGYQNPVIGWMEDIEAISIQDLKEWYQKWYGPNYATLVVVGDVKADAVYKLAKKYFGDIPATPEREIKPKEEVEPLGKRFLQVHADAKVPYLIMGYDAPSLGQHREPEEIYQIMVLHSVLDGGYSARFEKNIVRKQEIASSIGAHYDPYQRFRTQFLISATPSESISPQKLTESILEELNDLKNQKISEDELQRAKMRLIADFVYDQDSMREQAMQLGALSLIGFDLNKTDEILEGIKKVSLDEVQQIANRLFSEKGQTIAELIPNPTDEERL